MAGAHSLPKVVSFPSPRAAAPKRKKRLPVLLCCLCVVVAYFTYLYIVQEVELVKLRRAEAELRAIHAALEKKSLELEEEIKLLKTDEYVERIARDRLGLIKPNDKIFLPVYVVPRP